MSGHGRQSAAKGIHTPFAWKFADAAARTGFTPSEGQPAIQAQLTSEDLDRVGLQEDDGSLWRLTAITPTWSLVGGSATSSVFQDSDFRVVDDGDNTKQIAFEASGITTATTRTITVPDANITIGGITSSAPANVTKAAAAVGTSAELARADHKHDITTAAPGATGVATASGEGSSTSLARADHTHQSNTAPVNVTKAAAAIGTSGEPARADHKHDVTTAVAGAVQAGDSAAEGSATSLARSDHAHSVAVATPSTIGAANSAGAATSFVRSDHVHAHGAQTDGTMHAAAVAAGASGFMTGADKTKLDGIAASAAALTATAPVNVTKAAADVGVGTTAARHDHKHDVTTAAAGATQAGASAAEGSATSLARSDHAHSVAVAVPSTIGTANSAGASTSFVRADHVHAHGAQTDGSLHAAVVAAGASGFMTGADKTKLDAIPAGATGQVQYHNGSGGLAAEAGFEYDAGGNQLTVPGLTITQDVLFTGIISPTSLGSSQNDYAPTGFATASTLRLTSSTAVDITGLAGGASGRYVILHNIGSNNITLLNSSGSSTAANQFLFDADITLAANQSVTLLYDGTSSRWRTTGGTGSGPGGTTSFRKVYTAYEFESPFTNYAQNAFAAVAADTSNAGLLIRRFDDSIQEGVGFGLTIPSTATSLTMYFKSRAQSTPGGTVNVVPVLYSRSLPDNAAVGSWSGGTTLTSIAFTTNTNWQYDSQTITLATLGLTAGNYVQFELVRNGPSGSDTLSGDWVLLELIMEFT